MSLAHAADFEEIAEVAVRDRLESRRLLIGADLIGEAGRRANADTMCAVARDFNGRDNI